MALLQKHCREVSRIEHAGTVVVSGTKKMSESQRVTWVPYILKLSNPSIWALVHGTLNTRSLHCSGLNSLAIIPITPSQQLCVRLASPAVILSRGWA